MEAAAASDRRRALYDVYLAVPTHQRAEIIDGTLYVSPRPPPKHANAVSVLGGELNAAFQLARGGPGGWWILDEPELQLTALEPVAPDIVGWRRQRMPRLPHTEHFSLVPDWICEVLSPSTDAIDRGKKLPIYAAHGVSHMWLIDPFVETLEVYTLGPDRRWKRVDLYEGTARVRVAPFAAIEIDLSSLWAP